MKRQPRYPRYTILLICLLIYNLGYTQQCDCTKDFNQLDELLRKTPAFKDHKSQYLKAHQIAQQELSKIKTDFDCLVLLNQLTLGVNDNHIKVFGMPEGKGPKIEKSTINLDSLEQNLKTRSFKVVEGIYKLPNYVTLGLFKKNEKYVAVILKSDLVNWQPGEIMYTLIPFSEDLFLTIFGQRKSKRLVAISERIKHGMFLKLGLKKDLNTEPWHLAPERDSLFIRSELDAETTYIKAGSFDSFYPTLSDAEAFYSTLQNSLTKPNLIVDLRDNTGGGQRNSNILLEILSSYSEKNKIYALTNHNTGSNAEQFAVKLKKLPNVKVIGDRTQGTLAYEKKKNVSNPLSCGKFVAIMTSKRHKPYLEYESIGVSPEIFLNYNEDWITQTLNIINK